MNNNMQAEFSVPVDQSIRAYMVKYSRLDQLVPFAYEGSRSHNINLYIDLYSLYRTLFSRSYRTKTNDHLAMTSALISLCSHYRSYFRRLQVYCKIFIVASYNLPSYNTKVFNGYNRVMSDKLMNKPVSDMVSLNIDLMKIITEYLQGIYFVTTDYESTVMMRYLILSEMEKGNYNPNMIITKDAYPLQLIPEFPGTTLLRPRKVNNQDISEIVYPVENRMFAPSFWNFCCNSRDKLKLNPCNVTISPVNFVLYSALSRFPERNMPSLLNSIMANNIIYNVVQDTPVKLDIETLYMTCSDSIAMIPEFKLTQRFNALNAAGLQYNLFMQSTEPTELCLNDLKNPEALNMINATYFKDNPLDLYNL